MIGNEVIKYGIQYLEGAILSLYNKVLSSGTFPKIWNDGIIVPIHKKNDKLDVNNYRGIVVSSCVGKVLLKIISKRIEKFMQQSNKWSINQGGFKSDHRTEDHMFVINNVYEKYVTNQNKKVYLAFIDFSKFFDKINRHMMLYKLLKYGITGQVYRMIKSIYNRTEYSVQINDECSPLFQGVN